MKILFPRRLKPGDKIGIISPSSGVTSLDELRKGMDTLRKMGFSPVLSKNALVSSSSFQAGTAEARIEDFHEMFSNPEIKAVACTTGGYSSIELLPRFNEWNGIDWNLIKKNPKIFFGYSDITTLLVAIYENTGLITFHGPMIEGFNRTYTRGGRYTYQNLKKMITEGRPQRFESYSEWKVLKPGIAEGTLIGGNLNVLLSLIGTPYEPDWKGKILFWEEVDETIEGFNHYLIRMNVAGIFEKISGMIIGKITNLQSIDAIDEEENILKYKSSPTIEEVVLNATAGFHFPILSGVDFGHDVPSITIPIGAKGKLYCPSVGEVGHFFLSENVLSGPIR